MLDLQSLRYVIIHADDFGMCHTTNQAILHLFEQKAISSTTLMVNCPWSLEAARAAAANPALDVGVHFTLTSEWESYKWGPVLRRGNTDTLVDEFGHFPAASEYAAHADPAQIRAELTAQIESALRMGVVPTHFDNHMGTLRLGHYQLFAELAEQYDLPIRFVERPSPSAEEEALIRSARDKGILYPNEVLGLPFFFSEDMGYEATKDIAIKTLKGLKPGVTELVFHPSRDTDELKAITDTWPYRRYEFDLFLDPEIRETIKTEEIQIIGWRELRDLQRQMRG